MVEEEKVQRALSLYGRYQGMDLLDLLYMAEKGLARVQNEGSEEEIIGFTEQVELLTLAWGQKVKH